MTCGCSKRTQYYCYIAQYNFTSHTHRTSYGISDLRKVLNAKKNIQGCLGKKCILKRFQKVFPCKMFRTSNKAKEPLTIRRRILCDSCNIFGTSCTDSRENSLVFANIRAKINECSQIFARILANIRVFVNIREYSDIHEYSNIQNIHQDSNLMEA